MQADIWRLFSKEENMDQVIDLKTPLTSEDVEPLRAGDSVTISGTVYTARDAAHRRLIDLLD
jgi:fumarate hydratase subunit beta